MTVASLTGRGGHGRSGRSTGQVGPATTDPLTPEVDEAGAVAPGVTGGDVTCGAFVGALVADGELGDDVAGDDAGVTRSALPQPATATASTRIRTLVASPSGDHDL